MTWQRGVLKRFSPAFFVFFALTSTQLCAADITLTQANGDELTLSSPAQRIITLAPNLAEIVFAAGAGEQLKAVVEYSNFPAQVQQIRRVGDAFRIDLEQIMALEPDLVIAWASGNPQAALQKLEQLGIIVWQIEITRPEEIADAVANISRAAGTEAVGQTAARQLRDRIEQLRLQNAHKDPVNYFFQIAPRPLYTINGQHIISRGLEVCGARNVFADLSTLAPPINRESVIMANPQAMIAPESASDGNALDIWLQWPQLQAVKNKKMLYLPADEISQAVPRLLDSIALACKFLDDVRKTNQHLGEQ